jgi:xeroderma pigmentosum group C-complementing protein
VASQKRDEEWWRQTLAPLKELQHAASLAAQANGIAATNTAIGGGGGKDGGGKGGSKAGAAAREDLGPRAAAVARKRQRQAEAADRGAVQLAAEREDAELAERAQRVRCDEVAPRTWHVGQH